MSLVAAGLSSVAPAAGATKGCYFHHPDSAVCIYIEAVSVATVAITLVFGIVDYCLSVRRKRGKRFKVRCPLSSRQFMVLVSSSLLECAFDCVEVAALGTIR